jgi:DNA invertase Pin-like site-specific DNA recombinase
MAPKVVVTTDAALYLRLSKDHVEQTSTARQEAEAREHAEQLGLEVSEVFSDLLSGFRRDVARPGFEAAVDWVTAEPGRTLVVWKLDRLSRRGIGQVGLVLDRLEAVRSRVIFVKDGLDSSVPGHRMVIAILAEQARTESENTSARVRSALEHRRRAGRWPGGRPPYGWRLVVPAIPPRAVVLESFHVDPEGEAGRLVLDRDKAPILRRVVDEFLEGRSTYEIASCLSAEGVPAPRGGSWRAPTLWTMLRSPVLAGWLPEGKGSVEPARDPETGEPVDVAEPLVTPAERRRILDTLNQRSTIDRRGKRSGKPIGKSLLAGLLRCAECEAPMVGRLTQNSYACSTAVAGAGCPGTTCSMAGADFAVADAVLRRLAAMEPGDELLHAVAARWVAQHEPAALADRDLIGAELADMNARLADLEDARYLRGEFTGKAGEERYARLHERLQSALSSLQERLAALPSPEADLGALLDLETSREAWATASLLERRSVLRMALDRVLVAKPQGRHSNRFDPGRLRIVFAGSTESDQGVTK